MSDFKVDIKTSEVLPEIKILKPDPWFDYRGEMWTFWEKENEVLPKRHEWKISKFTRSSPTIGNFSGRFIASSSVTFAVNAFENKLS